MEMTFRIQQKEGWEFIQILGPINEDAEVHLAKLAENLPKQIVFNFRSVENVNSCGVRAWINFLRSIEGGRVIVFDECTPEIVAQINMIPNFKGQAHIRSVYGSYTCPACGAEKSELFIEGRNLPKTPEDTVAPVACPKCNTEMELEELEEEYFQWLESA